MDASYVGKPCPKCGHVRGVSEVAPDWRCPKCGVAYAKALQAQPAPEPVAVRPSTRLAILAHLSFFFGFVPFLNFIVPIAIWQMKRDEDELAVACAKESINFQISMLLGWLVFGAGIFIAIVMGPLIYVVSLLGVVLAVANVVLPIIAAVKASDGESYSYPYTWHIFE